MSSALGPRWRCSPFVTGLDLSIFSVHMQKLNFEDSLLKIFETHSPARKRRTRQELEEAFPLVCLSLIEAHGIEKFPSHMQPSLGNMLIALNIPTEQGAARDSSLRNSIEELSKESDPALIEKIAQVFSQAIEENA